ncbi:MAG: hypothetical protein IPL79_20140 [Myxococcales bacterium]|nr:hypothetical protein [Myxococcales bacterium]
MSNSSGYKPVYFDLQKGQVTSRGRAKDQAMIPRLLRDLYYDGDTLVGRPAATAINAGYDPLVELPPTTESDTPVTITNVATDGERVFGVGNQPGIMTSTMPDPGLGTHRVVYELKREATDTQRTIKTYWHATNIPEPKAATKLMEFGAIYPSSIAGSGDDLYVSAPLGKTASGGGLYHLHKHQVVSEPAHRNYSGYNQMYPDASVTRAVGTAIYISADSVASRFLLFWSFGRKSYAFKLRTTAGVDIPYVHGWDARVVGTTLYLARSDGGSTAATLLVYRFDVSNAVLLTGSTTSTPTTINAATQATITPAFGTGIGATTNDGLKLVSISSGCETELRIATFGKRNSQEYIGFYRRDLSTLVSVASYEVAAGANTVDARTLTCNDNIILCEEGFTSPDSATWNGDYLYTLHGQSQVRAYVMSGSTIVGAAFFPRTFHDSDADTKPFRPPASDYRLLSGVSSGGLVCIGQNIYRVGEFKSFPSDGYAANKEINKLAAIFICKAIDVSATLNSLAERHSAAEQSRMYNILSGWVDERYVVLPVGSYEQGPAFSETAGGLISTTGMLQQDQFVLFDIKTVTLSCVKTGHSVTSFAHGFSLDVTGKSVITVSPDRPVPSATTSGSVVTRENNWPASTIVSYRAVIVATCGGKESYVAGRTQILNVTSALDKDVTATFYYNPWTCGGCEIRVYRNASPANGAGDFFYLDSVTADGYYDPTTESTFGSASVVDFRIPPTLLANSSLDPTGGGESLQGYHMAGMRSIAVVQGRPVIATQDAVYPSQIPLGDDALPMCLPDVAVKIPYAYGSIIGIAPNADDILVATDRAVLGINGGLPDAAGGGFSLAHYNILSGVNPSCAPIETPAGLIIPHKDGCILFNGSVNEIGSKASGFDFENASGYYSTRYGLILSLGTGTEANILVYDIGADRWCSWLVDGATNSVACPVYGRFAGAVIVGGAHFIPSPEDDDAHYSAMAYRIDTGWCNYGGRFVVSSVRRIMMDGYDGTTGGALTTITSNTLYDLNPDFDNDESEEVIKAVRSNYVTNQRDSIGFRWQIHLGRRKASTHRHVVDLTVVEDGGIQYSGKIEVHTLAADVMVDVAKYTAHTVDPEDF